MNSEEQEYTILTPIYKKDNYQYHECSNCKSKIYMEESYLTPFYFKEKIKYCPFCGNPIIRYGNPKFEEEIDWTWLNEYRNLFYELDDYLQYKIHCKMTDYEQKELKNKIKLGKEYFKDKCFGFISNEYICNYLYRIANYDLHYSTKRKLERKFENMEYRLGDDK